MWRRQSSRTGELTNRGDEGHRQWDGGVHVVSHLRDPLKIKGILIEFSTCCVLLEYSTSSVHLNTLSMDPVSATGLVSALVSLSQFTGEVLLKLYRYYVEVKEGPIRAAQLREEVGFTLSQLSAITTALNSSTMTTLNIPDMKAACCRFRRTLETIDKATQPERLQGFAKLKWPFKKEDTARLIAEVERCKSAFSLAMNIEQTYFPVSSILSYLVHK